MQAHAYLPGETRHQGPQRLAEAPRVDGELQRDPVDLWDAYTTTRSLEARNALARHYAPLLRSVAVRMLSGPGRYVQLEDLEAYGFFGLCDAIEHFDPSRGFAFSTLAVLRIRGSIIDHLRSLDQVSRSVRSQVKMLDLTTETLVLELKRQPTLAEVAAEMDMPPDRVAAIRLKAVASAPVSLDQGAPGSTAAAEETLAGDCPEPTLELERDELQRSMAAAVERLRDKERYVIVEHWYKGRRYADIARDLGVTESRVCQLHSAAMLHLKASPGLASHYFD